MAEVDVFPYPKKSDDVYKYLTDIFNEHKSKSWKGKQLDIQQLIKDNKDVLITPDNELYVLLNFHLIYRSSNQINEACNKLWATTELYYHLKDGGPKLCNDFNSGFLPSSTVGTLYYAAISSLIGILSIFGVGSIVYKQNEGKKLKFLNLVRTSKGFIIEPRVQYLDSVFGTHKSGWHDQIIQMYTGFTKKGLELPFINIDEIYSLKSSRSYYDYDILSQTTMNGAFGESKYFKHLPSVVNIMETSIDCLKMIVNPIGNKCDIRFNSLKKSLQELSNYYITDY